MRLEVELKMSVFVGTVLRLEWSGQVVLVMWSWAAWAGNMW